MILDDILFFSLNISTWEEGQHGRSNSEKNMDVNGPIPQADTSRQNPRIYLNLLKHGKRNNEVLR
jgi:hypothetical protein